MAMNPRHRPDVTAARPAIVDVGTEIGELRREIAMFGEEMKAMIINVCVEVHFGGGLLHKPVRAESASIPGAPPLIGRQVEPPFPCALAPVSAE
jgi:hypothetical protein